MDFLAVQSVKNIYNKQYLQMKYKNYYSFLFLHISNKYIYKVFKEYTMTVISEMNGKMYFPQYSEADAVINGNSKSE